MYLFFIISSHLLSQNTDTIKIELPDKVYFYSPCIAINECIDTIYQISDTLFFVFQDNRIYNMKIRVDTKEDTNNDTTQMYMWDANFYPINKHTIKRYNIRLFVPYDYINYNILGIKIPYKDEICFFEKKRNYNYKYIGKKDLIKNEWYKRRNRDIPKWYFKDLLWHSGEQILNSSNN
jgi:hypothetical protein